MKKICAVVLISEQTIPNLMFLKWLFTNNYGGLSELFCVTTEYMEKKNKIKAIQKALGVINSFFAKMTPIIVDENNLEENVKKIELQFSDSVFYDEIHVNITGGTKIMSIACYEVFKNKENTVLYYQPVNKPVQILNSKIPEISKNNIEANISIKEYLDAYNVAYKIDNICVKDWNYNQAVLPIVENMTNERSIYLELQNNEYFRKMLKKKGALEFDKIDSEKLSRLQNNPTVEQLVSCSVRFGFGSDKITGKEIKYITGGWFEEYVYQKLKTEKKLDDDSIALNIRIVNSDDKDKNELDVAYIEGKTNPRLNIVECKSYIDEALQAKLLTDTLYKMQALKKDFGLTVKSYLYTMSVIKKESVLSRAKDLDIEIIDRTKLLSENRGER